MDDLILQKFQNDLLGDNESLSQVILHLNEMDRKRIARELHDSTIQDMVCLIHKIEIALKYIDFDPIHAKLELMSVNELIHKNIDELRKLVYDLRPMTFDDLGFDVLLKEYIEDLDHLYENEIVYKNNADFSDVQPDYLLTVFRIIKECCMNSVKHSNGGKIAVALSEENHQYHILVEDNGKGCDLSVKPQGHHYGLEIVKDRVALLKGSIKIYSEIDKGYRTDVWIPFDSIRIVKE